MMILPAINLLSGFKSWLQSRNYNPNTIRNYIADINKYFSSISNQNDIFSTQSLSEYISSVSSENNSSRYLASLNKFYQFALDQKIISSNPLKKIQKELSSDSKISVQAVLKQYQTHLQQQQFTLPTIKNYINDIHQFIGWLENNPS